MESRQDIPIMTETDILVVGGGPSGMAAAIAASREGMNTILMERFGCFGGNITQAGVEAFAWYRHSGTIEAGGITREIEDTAMKMGASTQESQSDSQALDAEMFKCVADKMIIEAGVKPLLHCMAVDTIIENGTIKGVITESKSGRQIILAKRVIDCTGDADIIALAGAPFHKESKDNLMQLTPVFNCKGVDTKRFKDYIYNVLKPTYKDWGGECWNQITSGKEEDMFSPFVEAPFIEAIEEGELEKTEGVSYGGTWGTIDDNSGEVMQINMIFMNGYDCTDVWDLTRAEIQGRKEALKVVEVLRKKIPGFENCKIRNFGMTIGTRESRKIKGHAYLTKEDVMNQGRFEDSIGIYPEFIDGLNYLIIPTTGRYYQIPYGSLVPKEIDNLLAAGRSISGDRVAHCSFRNMSCCTVTGQAAGTAAAISIKRNETTSKVRISEVQKALEKQGVRIF
ncbi:FAD-dependent oxidoreductase [Lachnospiraceae bacterium 62-35]